MEKKIIKIISITVASVFVASTIGLVFTGMYTSWGPFKGLFWNQEVRRVTKSSPYKDNQDGIVFYGPSNFRMWTVMNNDLPEYKVTNCGFGGSTDKLMVKYADKLLYPYNPKILFFQTGSNDYVVEKGTDEEKITNCMVFKKEMYTTFHEKLPETQFVVMSGLLLPGRSQYTSLTLKINKAIDAYAKECDYITYVDANKMTFDGTEYRKDLFINDGIHLNHTGQLKWRDEYIKPAIENVLKNHPELETVRK